jgi:hypothetical protein
MGSGLRASCFWWEFPPDGKLLARGRALVTEIMPDLPVKQGLRSLLCSFARGYHEDRPCCKSRDKPPESDRCKP